MDTVNNVELKSRYITNYWLEGVCYVEHNVTLVYKVKCHDNKTNTIYHAGEENVKLTGQGIRNGVTTVGGINLVLYRGD